MKTAPALAVYRQRLLNLHQRNRSLLHLQVDPRRDLDWLELDFLEGKPAQSLLDVVLKRRPAVLLSRRLAHEPRSLLLDQHLAGLHRALCLMDEETGVSDLFVALGFVEGKLNPDLLIRAPVLQIPVRLQRQNEKPLWALLPAENGGPVWNQSLFRALEKHLGLRLPEAFWENDILEEAPALVELWTRLHAVLHPLGLPLRMQSESLAVPLKPFRAYVEGFARREFDSGALVVQPQCVLGTYPQSDTALQADYQALSQPGWQQHLQQVLNHKPDGAEPEALNEVPPLPADACQLTALNLLAQGVPTVVHGPPGTGKSQWVANAVALAMGRGQRVLVVSHKRAALEVVHQRLAGLNLDRHCALLHDPQHDRPRVYAQVAQLLEALPRLGSLYDADRLQALQDDDRQVAQRMQAQLKDIQCKEEHLTRKLPCGLSLLEVYARVDSRIEPLTVPAECLSLTWSEVLELPPQLKLASTEQPLFSPEHPWHQRRPLLGRNDLEKVEAALEGLPLQAKRWRECRAQLPPMAPEHECWSQLQAILSGQCSAVQEACLSGCPPDAAQRSEQTQQLDRLAHLWSFLAEQERFTLPAQANWESWLAATEVFLAGRGPWAWASSNWRRARAVLKRVLGQSPNEAAARQLKAEGTAAQAAWSEMQRIRTSDFWRLWEAEAGCSLTECLEEARIGWRNACGIMEAWERGPAQALAWWNQWKSLNKGRLWQVLSEVCTRNRTKLEMLNAWKSVFSEFEVELLQQKLEADFGFEDWHQSRMDSWKRDAPAMLQADQRRQALPQAYRKLIEAVWPVSGGWSDERFQQLQQGFLRGWMELAEAQHPPESLAAERSRDELLQVQHNRRMAISREKIRLQVLRNLLQQALPVRHMAPQFRELAQQVSKRRRIWPLRKLVDAYWETALSHITPCVLASPETVSAVFPMRAGVFDLVIVDEASQCPVERALPALLRGKVVAVAGDEHQLPPLDLFRSSVAEMDAETDDHDTDTLLALESVLDLAQQYFVHTWLDWHYRSEQEALIRFSNRHFYHNRLRVLEKPRISPQNVPPLRWHRVDGQWKHRQNLPEARAIVKRALEVLATEPGASLAIVTLSQAQQECIEKLWQEEMLAQPLPNPPAVLIRNLENVQGHERDIVLLSIGYAPADDGIVKLRLGLINAPGGENRLNVAVTRARQRLEVFCSFEPEALLAEHALHGGPRVLRSFLEYVRNPQEASSRASDSNQQNFTIEHVGWNRFLNVLASGGWPVQRMEKGSRVFDAVVRSKRQPGLALLGLSLESPELLQSNRPLERSILQPFQWQARGWEVYRVRARNLALHPEAVAEDLIQRLNALDPDPEC